MKRIILLAAMMTVSSISSADICTNSEGSIIYESATKIGEALVVRNPSVMIAGKAVPVAALDSYDVRYTPTEAASTFCKAMGYAESSIGDLGLVDGEKVKFNDRGLLDSIARFDTRFVIQTVTCRNKIDK